MRGSDRASFMLALLQRKEKRTGVFVAFGKYVWLDSNHGYDTFGKGSLSRSSPTWLARMRTLAAQAATDDAHAPFIEQLTVQRRRQRRGLQGQNEADSNQARQILEATSDHDFEESRLDLYEAFYLLYALDAIEIHDPQYQLKRLSIDACWKRFNQCVADFATKYAVYHHYRSLGWMPKQGSKFGVDYILYRPGPRHMHGDFAVAITHHDTPHDWATLHRLTRVCTQVKKTLLLCYVQAPDSIADPSCLRSFDIRELLLKRWSPEKNRERSAG